MKSIPYLLSFVLVLFFSCNNADKEAETSENDVDAARNFIQSALYSDYEKASTYMLNDSGNLEWMNAIRRNNLSKEERSGLSAASINIHNIARRNDSTTIVIYSNSFKNNWDTLKVVKKEGKWLVDFKYLFEHSTDTLNVTPVINDTLR
jgi:hypothetical protein